MMHFTLTKLKITLHSTIFFTFYSSYSTEINEALHTYKVENYFTFNNFFSFYSSYSTEINDAAQLTKLKITFHSTIFSHFILRVQQKLMMQFTLTKLTIRRTPTGDLMKRVFKRPPSSGCLCVVFPCSCSSDILLVLLQLKG